MSVSFSCHIPACLGREGWQGRETSAPQVAVSLPFSGMNWGTEGHNAGAVVGSTIGYLDSLGRVMSGWHTAEDNTQNGNRLTLLSTDGEIVGKNLTEKEIAEMLAAQEEARRIAEEKEQEEEYIYDEVNDEQGDIGRVAFDFDGTIGRPTYSEEFKEWYEGLSADEKIDFLNYKIEEIENIKDLQAKSREVNSLRDFINDNISLSLFVNDFMFTDGILRDFLGNNPYTGEPYSYSDYLYGNYNLNEMSSWGSSMHQTTAQDGMLNVKVVSPEGLEAVFRPDKSTITDYPDRATYNYSTPLKWSNINFTDKQSFDNYIKTNTRHFKYDMLPFSYRMTHLEHKDVMYNATFFEKNSDSWRISK